MEESNATEENSSKRKAAQNNSENGVKKQGKDSASKFPEPQSAAATDSHSLAERVRRENISQRMKLLQDLVPGCNKMHQPCSLLQSSCFPLETSGALLPYISQPQQGNPLGCGMANGMDNQGSMHPLDLAFCRTMAHTILSSMGLAMRSLRKQKRWNLGKTESGTVVGGRSPELRRRQGALPNSR
ncbi:hypothetical protein GUJ93_ZPchr0005g16213 [Zizania palustris]|uniref:BHLH domain-containing protein n=1 Tax=Zizania palustris TaxID=103762 RepID=A0A8J5W1W3_ZIZPA|nr:hypothetical protein GUJ93_ZPchr0005g16213 [Zizania palustris]